MKGKAQQKENEAHLTSVVGREQEVEPGYKTSKRHFPHQCPTSGRFNNLPKQHYPAEDQAQEPVGAADIETTTVEGCTQSLWSPMIHSHRAGLPKLQKL